MSILRRFLLLLIFLTPWSLPAQPKAAPKDDTKVTVVVPLGAAPGKATKLTVRGLKLDNAVEVRFLDPEIKAKIVSKGKTPPVDKMLDVNKMGDTQVVLEVTLPAGFSAETTAFQVLTSTRETPVHHLLVNNDPALIQEKEPNNGFKQAQPIVVPQLVDGAIGGNQDVDVFRFEGKQGQKLICEVLAARYGSPLDSILTLSDDQGRTVASNDDAVGADSKLEVALARSGTYFLTVIDAHDQGSPAHVYRLVVREAK